MGNCAKETRCGWRNRVLLTSGIAAGAALIFVGLIIVPSTRAQAPTGQPPAQSLEAMEAAGIKMSFDVASVKPNKSDEPRHSNVPLFGNPVAPAGGLFSATNIPLIEYIWFAYDLGQVEAVKLASQLPRWAVKGDTQRFDIQARAQGNPTVDQMRLMMQSLLADRFKFALHTETKEGPIYALVLAKAGKLGPRLQQHTDDASCSTGQLAFNGLALVPDRPLQTSGLDLPPLPCGVIVRLTPSAPGLFRFGGRGISLTALIKYSSEDRPEFDHTDLKGTFDFDCETAAPSNVQPPNSQTESTGGDFA